MREARTPNTHERNKRFGYVAIAMFILAIMMLSGIVKSTSVKAANEEVSTTYKVGDILKVDSKDWNIRTEPSIYADIAYKALYGEQFEILSVEENNWYRLSSYLGEYYIQIVPECMDYFVRINSEITTEITTPEATAEATTSETTTSEIATETTTTETMTETIITETTTETTIIETTTETTITESTTETMISTVTTITPSNKILPGDILKFRGARWIVFEKLYAESGIEDFYPGEEFCIINTDFAPWYEIQREYGGPSWIRIEDMEMGINFVHVDISTTLPTTSYYKVGDLISVNSDFWFVHSAPNTESDVTFILFDNEVFEIKSVLYDYWYQIGNQAYIQISPQNNMYFKKVIDPIVSTATTITTEATTTTTVTTTTVTMEETDTTTGTTVNTTDTYRVGNLVRVNSDFWNVRKRPSKEAEIYFGILDNAIFKILEVIDDYWYKIGEEAYLQISPENRIYFERVSES